MIRKLLLSIAAFLLVGFIGTAKADNPLVTSFPEAAKLAQDKGTKTTEDSYIQDPSGEWVKVTYDCYIYKLGGVGEGGWWTFYTIKYYPQVSDTVIIIYKPEYGTVIILRKDPYTEDKYVYGIITEIDHSTVVDAHETLDEATGNGLVNLFVRPMQSLQVNSPWEFTPDEKMRRGDCWKINPQGGSK